MLGVEYSSYMEGVSSVSSVSVSVSVSVLNGKDYVLFLVDYFPTVYQRIPKCFHSLTSKHSTRPDRGSTSNLQAVHVS